MQSVKLALILKNLKTGLPQGITEGKAKGPVNSGGLFSGLLDQAMKSAGGLLVPMAGKASRSGRLLSPAALKATKTGGKVGDQGWLEHFRNQLMLLGIPIKEMSLSREAMPDLKKILIGEGLPESEVTGFLNRLFQENGNPRREIKLIELFERLPELKALSDKKSADPVLDMSAVPYIEASLSRLGLDHREVSRAIEQAKMQDGRLNLKRFVLNLQTLVRGLPEAKQLGADGKAAEDIKEMLVRVGIVDKATDIDGPVSLERFIRVLEQKVANLMPRTVPETEIEDHVNRLLDNVLVENKQQNGKTGLESLYANKLKVFPNDKSKADQDLRQIATEGRKNLASQGKKAGAEAKGAGEFQAKENELFLKTERLIKAAQEGSPEKKTIDQDKATSPHWVRESMADRGPAPDAIPRQGSRPLPVYVVNQVSRQISLSLKRGDNHIRLQLRPPQLGAIQIDMNMKDSVLKIGMATEHNAVKEFLISNIQELRESLLQQGVKLERVDIQVNCNLDQSMAQAQRDLKQGQSWRGGPATGSAVSAGEADGEEEAIADNMRSNALLSIFA
ncbi:MAG: flagellar hook-length control protein FliK [Desulfobacterales bacterium]|nr:flagellar hook-length control protein FliK [Desulfobacterales bacterium]